MKEPLSTQSEQRWQKLQQLRQGKSPYPNDFKPSHRAEDIHAAYSPADGKPLPDEDVLVSIAGRLMTRRIMGKVSFVHIQDNGRQIQLFVARDSLPEGSYQEQFKQLDIGDIIGVTGVLFITRSGELSVRVASIRLLAKSLHPLPEKYHGITDQEARYRQRYVDLIINKDSRAVFLQRSAIIRQIRKFLLGHDYLEVETPMLQFLPGGALARPFATHHNTLDIDLYLRVAPELNLKRLLVGGFTRVFEINRNFRNEGISTQHNPEFTMLEFYQAYADYQDLMDLTEEMFAVLLNEISNSMQLTYQGEVIDFSKFNRMTMTEAIVRHNPELSEFDLVDEVRLRHYCQDKEIPLQGHYQIGKIQLEIFEKTVEHKLRQPTFITAYPTEVSPLSRSSDCNPEITDRFELFIAGREIANGFSELNDPEDQVARFRSQQRDQQAGNPEAMHYDADYIRALEYGMPPTAGEGIGIDRLVMLLTDQPSIRDVLLFPQLRPESQQS